MDMFSLLLVVGIVLLALSGFFNFISWSFNAPAIIVLALVWLIATYNRFVTLRTHVREAWADIEVQLKRRYDLIPNLVAVVEGATDYEGEVLRDLTEARASVGKAQTPAQLQAAGEQMDSALSRLLVVVENYPNLKATEAFLSLQDQLEGTENRIKTERDLFNKAIKDYNVNVRSFPNNFMAGMFGFSVKEGFVAAEGADVVPIVDFDD